jgi:hypothetical protein
MMAGEIKYRHNATGATLYVPIQSEAGTYYNVATDALETLDPMHWYVAGSNRYNVPVVETPAGGYLYVGTFPASLAAGWYYLFVTVKSGADPAITDTPVATISGYWDGTTFHDDGFKALTETA